MPTNGNRTSALVDARLRDADAPHGVDFQKIIVIIGMQVAYLGVGAHYTVGGWPNVQYRTRLSPSA